MTSSRLVRALPAAVAAVLALAGGQAVAAPAPTERAAARVVTYDASGAAEFKDAVAKGVAVWNESVANVQLKPATSGQRANVRVVADDGWPRAAVTGLGSGTVYFGRQAVDQGYNTVRISSHELGHILGLPDKKPGPCSSLMSGSTAGTSCTNPYPDASEKSEVEGNFGVTAATSGTARTTVHAD
ncbi:snapalysin family zinc-dependent metalloprotease [Streptomyces sp. NA02950]|uniref:snapalysin family zinc-dependent metalloprotease n=1 Tax=Streptomyces sp. NA02950 TaxID=2742137 RepID=UPI00158FF2CD|nr:snapalysin family zinc-dependent metalloprotease [Streptomyces sp. NA02950]QKV91106.1 snapalysin family zinc-dependent metalloprotease [Streptomyces sp. NA02950]